MNQITALLAQGLLTDGIAHVVSANLDGIAYGAKMGLLAAPLAPTLLSVFSDVVEPTYAGYAEIALTWVGPYQQPDNSFAISSNLALFQMGDALTPTTVYGYFVVDKSMSPKLLWVENFATPVGLVSAQQALLIAAQLAIGGFDFGKGAVVV